jgi:hypothetical protein
LFNFSTENTHVKRQTLVEGVALVALIVLGVLLRIVFRDLPNFAPVAALALFAGYYFRSPAAALCVPLGVMTISDLFLGGYQWQMMTLVYGMLAAPVALRGLLRRYLDVSYGGPGHAAGAAAGLIACSLGASLAFFFATNLGTWVWSGMYDHSSAGLLSCYVQALPFFRYTLTGDLFFAVVLFGGYATVTQVAVARSATTCTAA